MERRALVVGGTGMIGKAVLDRLLDDSRYARVVAVARRDIGRAHVKLRVHVVDFAALDAAPDEAFAVDDVFLCLGTTIRVAGSQERFRAIDHGYTVAVANRARRAGASRAGLVSSVGADERASNFYLRVKGETERDVAAAGFASLTVARPGLLLGAREERRTGEAIAQKVFPALSALLVGSLRRYRAIDGEVVARALVALVAEGRAGVSACDYDELVRAGR